VQGGGFEKIVQYILESKLGSNFYEAKFVKYFYTGNIEPTQSNKTGLEN